VISAAAVRRTLTPKYWDRWSWMILALSLTVLWRVVRYIMNAPLWGDEAFVANSLLLKNFWQLAGGLEHYQIVPLGFLWIEWVMTRLLGASEWALRLAPMIFGIAAVLVYTRLALRVLTPLAAIASTLIFAASYYPLRHAVELKPYGLDLFLATWVMLAMYGMLKSGARDKWVRTAMLCAVAVWCSYPAIFVITGGLAVLFVNSWRAGDRRDTWALVRVLVVACLSFVVMFTTVGRAQLAASGGTLGQDWVDAFPPTTGIWDFVKWMINAHTGRLFAYPNGSNNGGSIATFLLFCIGALRLLRRDRWLLALLLAPFALTFSAAVLHLYPYAGSARIAQHLAPAICILAGNGLAGLLAWRVRGTRNLQRRLAVIGSLAVLIIIAGTLRQIYKPYKSVGDFRNRQVVRELAQDAARNPVWIVFGQFGPGPGAPNWYDWAGPAARMRYYLLRYAPDPVLWAPDGSSISGSRPTLLLRYQTPDSPFPADQFNAYLDLLSQKLGAPQSVTAYDFGEGPERLTVYRFVPAKT